MDTLNIFCDASILKSSHLNETVGCPGFIATTYMPYYGRQDIIDEKTDILRHSTNNESEITAILMGVQKAVSVKDQFETINLFSDSRICIQSLRNWIFNWVNNRDENGMMYGSNHNYVSNQQIISRVVHTIAMNNLKINLWHQKGHVALSSKSSLENARVLFEKENHVTGVTEDFIKKISIFNDMIDKDTKYRLARDVATLTMIEKPQLIYPMRYTLDELTMQNYAQLINVEK